MVDHDHNQVKAKRDGEIRDQVHGDLLEGVHGCRGQGSQGEAEGWVFTLCTWQMAQPVTKW
jgi:hypothetical protein